MNELGYETTKDEMKIRFINIQNHEKYKTFIATTDRQLAGMVGMTKNYFYEQNGIYVRVLALVTKYEFTQNGIGRKLMETSENCAREIGANTSLLNRGNRQERTISQQFYQKIGYQIKSPGFIKKIVTSFTYGKKRHNCCFTSATGDEQILLLLLFWLHNQLTKY